MTQDDKKLQHFRDCFEKYLPQLAEHIQEDCIEGVLQSLVKDCSREDHTEAYLAEKTETGEPGALQDLHDEVAFLLESGYSVDNQTLLTLLNHLEPKKGRYYDLAQFLRHLESWREFDDLTSDELRNTRREAIRQRLLYLKDQPVEALSNYEREQVGKLLDPAKPPLDEERIQEVVRDIEIGLRDLKKATRRHGHRGGKR